MLIVEESSNNDVRITKTKFFLYSKKPQDIEYNKNLFNKYMHESAKMVFQKELEECINRFFKELNIPELKIRKSSKRWGSYKYHQVILNPLLIMADIEAIQYVITHELCHYYHRDHSPAFYSLLSSKIPSWQKIKDRMEKVILTYT